MPKEKKAKYEVVHCLAAIEVDDVVNDNPIRFVEVMKMCSGSMTTEVNNACFLSEDWSYNAKELLITYIYLQNS